MQKRLMDDRQEGISSPDVLKAQKAINDFHTRLQEEDGYRLVSRAAATPTLRAVYPESCGFRVYQASIVPESGDFDRATTADRKVTAAMIELARKQKLR